MEPDVITVRTTEDQEDWPSGPLMRYDFLSLPVVDQEDRLVGRGHGGRRDGCDGGGGHRGL